MHACVHMCVCVDFPIRVGLVVVGDARGSC